MSTQTQSIDMNKAPLLEHNVEIISKNDIGSSPMRSTSSSSSPNVTLTTKSWIQSILSQREMVFWCVYWFTANLTITFYNKHVLSSLNVSPLINTFVHMTFTFIGCLIVQKMVFPSLTQSEFLRIFLYSFIFALNIVWCQFAIKLTTLSLNQVSRAMTPLFQAFFSYLIANKRHTVYSLIPLIPVCCGVAMTASAELDLSIFALIVSLSSIVVSALKGVLSMKILQQDLKTKLQEYSFLILVTPLAAMWVIVLNLLFYFSYYKDNTFESNDNDNDDSNKFEGFSVKMCILLSIGGCFAFAVNVASIGTVKRTSATSMGVMANSKQALTIFGSMIFYESGWRMQKLLGVCVAIAGAALYSYSYVYTLIFITNNKYIYITQEKKWRNDRDLLFQNNKSNGY